MFAAPICTAHVGSLIFAAEKWHHSLGVALQTDTFYWLRMPEVEIFYLLRMPEVETFVLTHLASKKAI